MGNLHKYYETVINTRRMVMNIIENTESEAVDKAVGKFLRPMSREGFMNPIFQTAPTEQL